MEIVRHAMAGTMESSDIQINLEPNSAEEIEIYLKSAVEKQYGDQIRTLIRDTLVKLGVTRGIVRAVDKGALDCTIRARVQTAVNRAAEAQAVQSGGRLS